MGLYESAKKYVGWPITPGFELAGVVASVGPGVEQLKPGDTVFGVTRFGAYATHVAVPATQVFRVPDGFDMQQAATFPAVFLTAWYSLVELANARAGTTILVHSAAGGVGCALLQLGKAVGCKMVGVVGGAHKVATAKQAGADEVIDKSSEDLWRRARQIAPEGYGIIFDPNGRATLRDSYRHLGSPGKLVVYGFHSMLPRSGGKPRWGKLAVDYLATPRFDPLELTNRNCSILAFNLSYLFEQQSLFAEGMQRLLGWVREGRLRPLPVTEFPLERVADAHRALESGSTVGKLVLIP